MKTIKFKNGQILYGYELSDLKGDEYDNVINNHIYFEMEIMDEDSPYYECAIEMDRMQTPWFLGEKIWEDHKDNIIETIEMNDYLYDEDGEMLPLCYHTKTENGVEKTIKVTYGNKDYEVEIFDK